MDLQDLPGITTKKVAQFNAKSIYTVEDLLNFLPRRYEDLSRITGILPSTETSVVKVRITSVTSYNAKTFCIRAGCLELNTGNLINVWWFNQRWMYIRLKQSINHEVIIAGKVEYDPYYDTYSISAPSLFEEDCGKALAVYPIYSAIKGMSTEYIRKTMEQALCTPAAFEECVPQDILDSEKQLPMSTAYKYIYKPRSMQEVAQGKERVLFNDLLYFALHNVYAEREFSRGSSYNVKTLALYKKVLKSLPFSLTPGQQETLDEIIKYLKTNLRLNALLQGDVGCGKTIVSQLLMCVFVGSGYQAALMAPTQVLAEQHYLSTKELLEPFGVNVLYIGGSMTAAQKREAYKSIEDGTADIIIGTTAIISPKIKYKNLAITVVDEEQRFGVTQRSALIETGRNGIHSLTMSATPIPRSLAQTLYEDSVQLYTITQLPEGRIPIQTGIAKSRDAIYRYIIGQIRKGRQAYIVCPKIDKSDSASTKSVEEIFEEYSAALTPLGIRIDILTGRTGKTEASEIIRKFKAGETDILVSTTIIEVGVNVPNATTMVIVNAEMFGLSTLHQLRGRVGRGQYKSICVLDSQVSEGDGRLRLDALCRTTNGFEIAEEDLKIRGAGDFIGTQQSGDNKYISLMLAYPEVYKRARIIAEDLLDRGRECCSLVEQVYREKNSA